MRFAGGRRQEDGGRRREEGEGRSGGDFKREILSFKSAFLPFYIGFDLLSLSCSTSCHLEP